MGTLLLGNVKTKNAVLQLGEKLLELLVVYQSGVVFLHERILERVHVFSAGNEAVLGGHVAQILEFHLFNESL